MFQEYNPNPVGRRVGDCAVRAVAKALDIDWETAYAKIVKNGFLMADHTVDRIVVSLKARPALMPETMALMRPVIGAEEV